MTNRLYYGDNLAVLRDHIADASVDLVYLDPPFNSNAGYNVLFKSASGAGADASIEAFDDTWTWGEASKSALMDIDSGTNRPLQVMMRAMHDALGDSPLMAYLAMMAVRLVELHRVLKDTGSLYLHCDPTASHYLKLVLDAVFGAERFLNEVIWRRTGSHNPRRSFGPIHDTILVYTKSSSYFFDVVRRPYMKGHVLSRYTETADGKMRFSSGGNVLTGAGATNGPSGADWRGFNPSAKKRHWAIPSFYEAVMPLAYRDLNALEKLESLYQAGLVEIKKGSAWPIMVRELDERDGTPLTDIWAYQPYTAGTVWGDDKVGIDQDVMWLGPTAPERLGYPTQKPVGLLERIIRSSSRPGDVILDPFCGCGTAVDASQKLGRRWIGIDITHLAIGMIVDRINSGYNRDGVVTAPFETIGIPKDRESAEKLAADDPHQFQQWVSWQVGGYPREKKGRDKGVDGWFNYLADSGRVETGVISVKAGDIVNPNMVRDLGRVMERDKYRFGLFVMKAMPTKGMREEAASHPTIETGFGRFPALQIVTLAELMLGHRPKLPPLISPVKKAARVETRASHQKGSQGSLL